MICVRVLPHGGGRYPSRTGTLWFAPERALGIVRHQAAYCEENRTLKAMKVPILSNEELKAVACPRAVRQRAR